MWRGFRALYGSWKIICALRRTGTSSFARELGDLLAVELDLAAVGRTSIRIDRPTVVLPRPALADESERLARVDRQKLDAVDGLDLADGARDEPRDRTGK